MVYFYHPGTVLQQQLSFDATANGDSDPRSDLYANTGDGDENYGNSATINQRRERP